MDPVDLKRTIIFTGKSNGSGGIEKELEGGNELDLSNTPIHCMHYEVLKLLKYLLREDFWQG